MTFDIDANGILNVSAKDKATGKEQSIVIKASSGLSDEEIEKMVEDAKANAESDKAFHELVDLRNKADGLIHSSNKSLKDLGDKVTADEKSGIEAAIADLKEAVQGDDKADIEAKTATLSDKVGELSKRAYDANNADSNTADAADANTEQASSNNGDDVVDAEFEEVDDADKGK